MVESEVFALNGLFINILDPFCSNSIKSLLKISILHYTIFVYFIQCQASILDVDWKHSCSQPDSSVPSGLTTQIDSKW